MVERELTDKLLEYTRQYPVVMVTGPRQSGKTTLCRMLFGDRPYVSLEALDERQYAVADPRGFLARFPDGAVLDEIQRAPDLLSYLQGLVDEDARPGRFIVTGSQNLNLLASVTQSLAGRTALAVLLPFTCREASRLAGRSTLDRVLYGGFYPRIHHQKLVPAEALSFYVTTYLERDIRQLLNIQDLARFELFLRLCAGRTGQLVNLSALGNDCGITHNTAKSWLGLLEASYILKLVQPWHRNIGKRLVKTPKLYFLDTGLAACLLGIREAVQLATHPLRGALFETYVYSELLKANCNAGSPDGIFFYRDSKGDEVDFVIERGPVFDLVEAKAGATIASDYFKGIQRFRETAGQPGAACLVYGGEARRVQYGIEVLGWRDAWRAAGLP